MPAGKGKGNSGGVGAFSDDIIGERLNKFLDLLLEILREYVYCRQTVFEIA